MDIKEEIKNSVRLSEIISKNVSLKRRDKSNYIGLCPFHKEKTPSFNVSDDKGFFHCFGCGKNGDIFNYIMETENITFVEALNKLANYAGINYKKYSLNVNPKLKNNLNLLKRVSDSYIKNLNAPIGENARNYLEKRGINKSLIDNFRIGYSGNLKSNNYLVSCLIEEGFSMDDMIDVGLVKVSPKKNHVFYFQQRLMIPILNNSENIIAFGGRLLGEGNPKYLNSPETSLFQKSKQLFGVSSAKKLLNKKRLIICEGYMDVISLTSHGYPAVASLGTALTENQIENIFNISDEAFLVFDGDIAGKNATIRVFEKYFPKLKFNKKLKFVFLPDQLDPEEFINKNSLNEFEKILDRAIGSLDMLWMLGSKSLQLNEPETYAYFWDYLRTKVNTIENTNIRQAFRDEVEKRIRVFRQNIRHTPNRLSNLKYNNYNLYSMKKKLPKTGIEIKIGAIIYIMLSYPSVCSKFDEKISLLDFKSRDLNELKDKILKLVNEVPNISSKDLQEGMITKGFTMKIESFMQSNYPARLNLDLKNINNKKIDKVFEELINLVDIRKISLSKK